MTGYGDYAIDLTTFLEAYIVDMANLQEWMCEYYAPNSTEYGTLRTAHTMEEVPSRWGDDKVVSTGACPCAGLP